jgi:hypothetical protein
LKFHQKYIIYTFIINIIKKNNLPWEYPTEALTTLCWECHEELHKNEKVKYLNENGLEIGNLTPCTRCFGAGWFPEFNHIKNGICFKCNGLKYEEFIL